MRKHFPGEPNAGYATLWDEIPDWKREDAGAVHDRVVQLLDVSAGNASRLSREQ